MALKNKYPFLEKLDINNIYNTFLSLPQQQQTIALIAGSILLIILILLPVSLASGKIGRMEKMLEKNKKGLNDIVYEIEEYNQMRSRLESAEKSMKEGFDTALSTTLESLASKAGIKNNIESLKERPVVPTELFDESIVEVRLAKVTLPQLVDFLYDIERDKTKLLRVKEIRMRTRYDDKQLMDVSFKVSTYKLQETG